MRSLSGERAGRCADDAPRAVDTDAKPVAAARRAHHSHRRRQPHYVTLKPLPIGQLDSTSETSHPPAAVSLRLAMHTPARLLIFEHASNLADGAAPFCLQSPGSTVVGLLPLRLKETGTRRRLRQTEG
jgi:hypothetical protein